MRDGKNGVPLVVVAGQVPPPTGGQNIMIQRILDELSGDDRWRTIHLPFYFTPSFQSVRKFRVGKIAGLFAVWGRFLSLIFRHGRPDLLIYPSGGPQTVPVIRDILLLPLLTALSRRVVVQFHAAGIAERVATKNGVLEKLLRASYRRVAGAIVMTGFNRCDPEALGIRDVHVIPHRLPDENPKAALPDYSVFSKAEAEFNILYAGHLYELKGTPQLVEAFAILAPRFPRARLTLMGEFLPPYSEAECRSRCEELGISDRVEITGVLHGEAKAARFRSAHLFVFPSIAPYESFGLVMVEAMMWGLPIVASDWRGNRDVVGNGATLVPTEGHLARALAASLADTLGQGMANSSKAKDSRLRYETLFQLGAERSDYRNGVSTILDLARK